MEVNPAVKEELELMEMSYVKAEANLYDNKNLQKRLVKHNWYDSYKWRLSIIALLIASGFVLKSFDVKKGEYVVYSEKKMDVQEKENIPVITPLFVKDEKPSGNTLPQIKENIPAKVVSSDRLLNDTVLQYLPIAEIRHIVNPPAKPVQIYLPKIKKWKEFKVKEPVKVANRKLERQIEKAKAKAIENRKAEEFMKGNKPYIIPMQDF